MAWTSQGTRVILRDTGYALVDTVARRALRATNPEHLIRRDLDHRRAPRSTGDALADSAGGSRGGDRGK